MRKRKAGLDDDGDVTYINDANKVFNKKINRYFDKYTAEYVCFNGGCSVRNLIFYFRTVQDPSQFRAWNCPLRHKVASCIFIDIDLYSVDHTVVRLSKYYPLMRKYNPVPFRPKLSMMSYHFRTRREGRLSRLSCSRRAPTRRKQLDNRTKSYDQLPQI